ncbi:MAG: DNA-binding protein [Prevotella sp.]|nr:DNA-binding protein [Prevotella sp.]
MIKINFYKNKRQGDENLGKVYGRAENAAPITIDQLAEHMAQHNTPFSPGTIKGILTDMVSCIKELILMGQPVKLDNLAIFKASLESTPANDVETFDLNTNVKNLKLLAIATGRLTRKKLTEGAMLGYSSLAQRIKNGEVVLSSRKGEYLATSNSGSGSGSEPVVNP